VDVCVVCLRMVASAGSHFYKLNSICSRVLWAVVGKPAWVYLELMGVTKEMTEHERERSWTYGLVMVVLGGPLSILLLSFWLFKSDWGMDAILALAGVESLFWAIVSSGVWLMFPAKKWTIIFWVLGWLPFLIWALAAIFLCLALRLCS